MQIPDVLYSYADELEKKTAVRYPALRVRFLSDYCSDSDYSLP